ncbi:zinc-dependent metalloprotease [Actinotalea sp.]|uniref:zinc-dependent metalloprotease n=1 Tax=Actinotalea sp. TaxID=1872145 RepID=UPI0035640B0A
MSPALDAARIGRWAGRMSRPGPTAERAELERVVAELRAAGERALPIARRAGGFGAALPEQAPEARILVVDRPGWARLAAGSFASLLDDSAVGTGPGAGARAGWSASAELAGLLAALSTRVLGQFDPYGSDEPGGRLALVAPNVLQIGATMPGDPADFRLWICVHEQTHALQFAAAPWLAGHIRRETSALMTELEQEGELATVLEAIRSLPRGRPTLPDQGLGPLGALLSPTQRGRAAQLVATMSLLEGHADVTMDAVPIGLIPSRRRLRARMTARRTSTRGRLLRRLLGLDAKLEQYRRGADFVRAVRRTGSRALEPVWSGPHALPTPAEIDAPEDWLRRMSAT